jgi:AcrR family transcriptional regulator
LIENNSYNEITIQEIASECNISRRTIYRHFRTKDEILSYSFRSCVLKLADYISLQDTKDLRKLCLTYFRFWEENMDRLLMMNDAGVLFSFGSEFDSLVSIIAGRMISRSSSVPLTPSDISMFRYKFAFETAGFWQVTELWSREKPRRSAAEMAEFMVRIIGNN